MNPQKVEAHEKFSGVFWVWMEDGTRRLATENLAPEKTVYGEKLIKFMGENIGFGTLTEVSLQQQF